MMRPFQLVVAIFMFLTSPICFAGEYARFTVDLDGDKKPETIILSTSGSGDFQDFTVLVSGSTYTDNFLAVYGELPELHIVAIDRKQPSRQLLIKTQEPASCTFHLLSYSSRKLYSLLKFQSDGDCVGPHPHGNGTLSVSYWQGFWWKVETYKLDPSGTKLVSIPKDIYDVNIPVASKHDLILEKSECERTKVKEGTFVRIDKFDSQKQRYLLRTSDGVCGWLNMLDLDSSLSEIHYTK